MILSNSVYPAIAVWLLAVAIYFIRHGSWKFRRFHFSQRNYYIMLSPLLVGLAIYSFETRSIYPITLFALFGVAGMIGEAVTDKWWQVFFGQRLWVYTAGAIYHKYTSWLNFIPWGMGGYLYMNLLNRFVEPLAYQGIEWVIVVLLSSLILLQVYLFGLFKPRPRFKFHQVTAASLIVFYLPVIVFLAVLAALYGLVIWHLAFWFGVVATVAEYLYGKACQTLISKKLWYYVYLGADEGHFTPLSAPLFVIGGFYFWAISRFVSGLI